MLFISIVNWACFLLRQHLISYGCKNRGSEEENTVNMYFINVTHVIEIIPVQDWHYSPAGIYTQQVGYKVRFSLLVFR